MKKSRPPPKTPASRLCFGLYKNKILTTKTIKYAIMFMEPMHKKSIRAVSLSLYLSHPTLNAPPFLLKD